MKTLKTRLEQLLETITHEVLDEIAVYPSAFNVDQFKKIPDIKSKLEYVASKLPPLGKGSSRVVFKIDDYTVLKVARKAAGKAQNRLEVIISRDASHYPVARVFNTGDDDTWIEMEYARPITMSKFSKLAKIEMTVFSQVMHYYYDLSKGYNMKDVEKPFNYHKAMAQKGGIVEKAKNLIDDFDMEPGDMAKIDSWGVVKRNGQDTVVMIDFGFNTKVYTDFYVDDASGGKAVTF